MKRAWGKKDATPTAGQPPAHARQGPSIQGMQRYANAYIFGAFCPARDTAVGLIRPRADTAMMQLHLDGISAPLPPHVHAAMIGDGAGWHRSGTLDVPDHITLIDIPPDTPECTTAEKPWQYLKDTFLGHQVVQDYDAVLDACEHAWNSMLKEAGRVTSLTNMHYLLCHEI